MAELVTANDPRKVVVITGCSSGLGRSMAIEFDAQKAYRVFATARKLESLRELPTGIERVQLDVTDPTSIQAAFKEILTCTKDRIDILINNAGVNLAVGPIIETPMENIRKTFETNVSFPFDARCHVQWQRQWLTEIPFSWHSSLAWSQ